MYGAPPLDEKTLLESAERTRKELLAGLARRVSESLSLSFSNLADRASHSPQVTQHLSLPFLPATNPSLAKVHNLYSTAFFDLANIPEIKGLADNDKLCKMMANMVSAHTDNIPLLARGTPHSPCDNFPAHPSRS